MTTTLARPLPRLPAAPTHRRPTPRALALLPVLLSLTLGLWGVRRAGSVWRDEAVTYDMAHRTLPELWATAAHVDLVHTAYYALMHGLFQLFAGADPLLVMRLPSVAAAAVATAGVTALGRHLAGLRTGLLAGALFAVVPQVQRFSQEGRSYALVAACVIWATYLLVRAIRSGSRWTWAGYAALMLTASLLHEFAILAVVAHAWAVPRSARRSWACAALAAAAGTAPLALLSTGQSAQVSWIGLDVGGLSWFLGVGSVALLCALRLGRTPLVRLALPLAVAPGLLLLLASPFQPLFVDRYVLYGVAGQALLAGAGLDRALRGRVTRRRIIATITLAAVAIPTYSSFLRTPESRRDDVTAIAHAVRQLATPGDAILYEPGRRRVWSLADPASFTGLHDIALAKSPATSGWLYGTEVSPPALRKRLTDEERVVVLRDPAGEPLDADPGEVVKRRVLARDFEACRTLYPQGARVTLYVRKGHC